MALATRWLYSSMEQILFCIVNVFKSNHFISKDMFLLKPHKLPKSSIYFLFIFI